ncbi:hypothetical protein NCC49_002961 [Naganishia albida]|nr:hypothetical protein NCC49_002961 [Naganishia albida]
MSKPTLTIITTPASAPATEPPTPAYDDEPTSAHHEERSPCMSQPDSPSNSSAQVGRAERESLSTDEVVGTPAVSLEANNRLSANGQEEAGKVKAWSSTISTSESVPVGLRLPPIPDEATLRDLTQARSRSRSGSRSPTAGPLPNFGTGKGATRSMPSLKDTARQQSMQDPATRGRSPLAQANTSGPSPSPVSASTKPGPSGFKAFLMKTFGLGKSSEKQKKKDRTPVASPSPSQKTRNPPAPISRAKSPVAATPTATNPSSFVKISGSRSPPTLATPVFASGSPSAPSPYPTGDSHDTALAQPRSPADVPLPPSPLIAQDSPMLSASGFQGSQAPRVEETVPGRPSVESRKTDGSGQITVAISEAVPETQTKANSQTTERTMDLSSSEGARVGTSDQAHDIGASHEDSEDADTLIVMAKAKARSSPGRASIKSDSNRIMSAIEPRQAPPFSTSPTATSHVRPGSRPSSSKGAELHGGVTMSRSVTAEGMQEAEEIMGEKQQVLQEASEKLAAIAARSRVSVDNEEEEAKDSFGSDLGFPPRATARKVSPTPSSGIPKYGRSISAPGGDRIPNDATGTAKNGFLRKPSVTAGQGLTRSGSKLRTSVYGLTDILHKKETTPKQKRISASPTMHTMGTIMREANEIMDQDERDRAESFFMS